MTSLQLAQDAALLVLGITIGALGILALIAYRIGKSPYFG